MPYDVILLYQIFYPILFRIIWMMTNIFQRMMGEIFLSVDIIGIRQDLLTNTIFLKLFTFIRENVFRILEENGCVFSGEILFSLLQESFTILKYLMIIRLCLISFLKKQLFIRCLRPL